MQQEGQELTILTDSLTTWILHGDIGMQILHRESRKTLNA